MISGATRLAAVIGDPVRHSLSPKIHNAAFAANGLDWVYLALPVAAGNGGAAVEAMRTLGIDGLSVTMPHKDVVAAAVDRRTASVEALGSCNCVYRDGGVLVGDNTDGDGFVAALRAEIGLELSGVAVGVIGAGGAGRSIIDAVSRAGADRIVVVNRSEERARRACALSPVAQVASADELRNVDVVVNATSVGMGSESGAPGPVPLDPEILTAGQVVADIVYQPLETPLLLAARQVGATAIGGTGMLVHQAALAFERWTGERAPLDVMRAAVVGDQSQ